AQEKTHVVAFSMGGYLALEYALEHPQNIASLTMVGASAFGLPPLERERRLRHLPMLEQGRYKGISRHRLAQFVHSDRLDAPQVAGVVREMDARLGKHTLIQQIQSVSLRSSFLEDLPQLRTQTQLIGATQDAIIQPDSLHQMQQRIAYCQLHFIKDTGHMIPLERPQELAQLLTDFIAR
ncbi:MAG: alpha/beta hydrolase, partial [Alphaproteobacteria bacterium]|nr:alpha/beta hydrolase [Alphaproteobacteria bacterium]